MSSLEQKLKAVNDSSANFAAQLRELDQLREELRMAQLSAQTPRRQIGHQRRGIGSKSGLGWHTGRDNEWFSQQRR
jgi:hypothetical protein